MYRDVIRVDVRYSVACLFELVASVPEFTTKMKRQEK